MGAPAYEGLDVGDESVPGTVDEDGFTLISVADRIGFEGELPRYRVRTLLPGFRPSSDKGDAEASGHSSSHKDTSSREPMDGSMNQDSSPPVGGPPYGSSGSEPLHSTAVVDGWVRTEVMVLSPSTSSRVLPPDGVQEDEASSSVPGAIRLRRPELARLRGLGKMRLRRVTFRGPLPRRKK
ncbi:hypothetical protein HPB50_010931 [Hyalomma asiaticum]|uniref:Uncharacterized protein n=1 Tax=Hyalomma asiaticum TaxID=266040 RepID=A0ACB7TEJ9_HYAAI|nr:hypothetical protein HPB50_010931 [Hyalomma asiaticum]